MNTETTSIYQVISKQIPHIFEGESNFISNASNFSSLLYNSLDNLNWCGFYFKDGNDLILGPFQGKTACVRIPIGKGVCGKAALLMHTILVEDVHQFEGHIACDPNSNSEIVIPILIKEKLYGVLDIDSPNINRFNESDSNQLFKLLSQLISLSDEKILENAYQIF